MIHTRLQEPSDPDFFCFHLWSRQIVSCTVQTDPSMWFHLRSLFVVVSATTPLDGLFFLNGNISGPERLKEMTFPWEELLLVHLWFCHWHNTRNCQTHRAHDCIYANYKLISPLKDLKRSMMELSAHLWQDLQVMKVKFVGVISSHTARLFP